MIHLKVWIIVLWMSCFNHNVIIPHKIEKSIQTTGVSSRNNLNPRRTPGQYLMQNHIRPKWISLGSKDKIEHRMNHCNVSVEGRVNVTRCFDRTGVIPCDRPVPVGSSVFFQCPAFYKPTSFKSQCQKSGSWSDKISCIPVCGVRQQLVEPLIMHGKVAGSGQWPWAAALYRRKNEAAQWQYACGATLVSDIALITAAHCVDKGTRTRNILITLGRLSNNIPMLNETGVFKVDRFSVLPLYKGKSNQLDSDISILILKSTVQLSESILPACIPNFDAVPHKLTYGIVAGWGKNEKYIPVKVLHYTYLPIVNNMECLAHSPEEYVKFHSFTKFCAGYVNGTGVCNGDSGSGLLTEDDGRWYLHGVVSSSPPNGNSMNCSRRNFSLFTKVKMYKDWISNFLAKNDIYI